MLTHAVNTELQLLPCCFDSKSLVLIAVLCFLQAQETSLPPEAAVLLCQAG